MGGDLDEDIRLRQVEAGVRDLGHKDSVDLGVVLKVLEDLYSLRLAGRAVDVGLVQGRGVVLEGVNVVREDNCLVASLLVVFDEKLRRSEFVWIHHTKQHLLH